MNIPELIDNTINSVHPKNVPQKYIIMVKILDIHGLETSIKGSELEKIYDYPKSDVLELRFILNLHQMKLDAIDQFEDFMEMIREN